MVSGTLGFTFRQDNLTHSALFTSFVALSVGLKPGPGLSSPTTEVGTAGYLSPEMVARQGHGLPLDYYCLGCREAWHWGKKRWSDGLPVERLGGRGHFLGFFHPIQDGYLHCTIQQTIAHMVCSCLLHPENEG